MRCEKCGRVINRDVVAVLNIRMWGVGFPMKALYEPIEREGLSGSENKENLCVPS